MHPSKAGIYREKCILSTLLCNLSFSCRYIFKAHVTENNHNESKRQTFIVFTNIYPTLLFRTEIGTLAYWHIKSLLKRSSPCLYTFSPLFPFFSQIITMLREIIIDTAFVLAKGLVLFLRTFGIHSIFTGFYQPGIYLCFLLFLQ